MLNDISYTETTPLSTVEELPDAGNFNDERLGSENKENDQAQHYEKSSYLALRNNVSIEDVIATRINNNFQDNFPNSIKMYNDIVLPTKETVLKDQED